VKFDKQTIIAFVICMILLMAWQPFCVKMGWITPPETAAQQADTDQPASTVKPANSDKAVAVKAAAHSKTAISAIKAKTTETTKKPKQALPLLPSRTIGDKLTELKIDPNRGTVLSVTLKNFLKADRKTALTIDSKLSTGALNVSGDQPWTTLAVVDNNRVTPEVYSLTRKIAANGKVFMLTQKWSVSGYVTDYSIIIKNPGNAALTFDRISVIAGGMPLLKNMTGDKVARHDHRIACYTKNGKYFNAKVEKEANFNELQADAPVAWVGASNKYFTCILKTEKPFAAELVKERIIDPEIKDEKLEPATGVIGGSWLNLKVPAKGMIELKTQCYNGPKEMALLKKFDPTTVDVMHLAFGPLEWISRTLLALLTWLYGICGSYGWSIILLTLIVRGLLWPLTQKANRSMKRMQKLKPEIDKLNKQYADNPQMKNTKVMQLYRDHKINPVGGCLPILLQIPIFIALYNTLDGAVQLRQVAFLWSHDLTLPDTVATVLGLNINPLVIMMTGLMLLQQKMMPTPADAMQQKMMMFMPLVMLFFLYSLPSGLTLYWTVSQICSIAQMYINQNIMKDSDELQAPKKA
jgi:YidC/Oxa1 family membrane protein insertase